MKNEELKVKNGRYVAFVVLLLGAALNLCFASTCRIERVEWDGDHSEFEELSMSVIVGAPCDSWRGAK